MVVLGKHGEAVQHPHPQSVRIPTKFWCDSCSGVHNSFEEDFSIPGGRRSTLCISYLNCMCPSDRRRLPSVKFLVEEVGIDEVAPHCLSLRATWHRGSPQPEVGPGSGSGARSCPSG